MRENMSVFRDSLDSYGPIDDNILITVCATAVLLLGVQLH